MIRFYCDIETTGLNHKEHGIIQIAGLLESQGEVVERIDLQIKPFPGDKVDGQALEVNGKDLREIMNSKDYLRPEVAHIKLCDFLGQHVDKYNRSDKAFLVGYNLHSFDQPFLREWFQKCGDKYFGSWFWFPPIDVMLIAVHLLANRRPDMVDFKLPTVCRELGIGWDERSAHDAGYDINKTREAFLALELLR